MSSSSFSSLISEMGRKLQINATYKESGIIVADLDALIGPHFEAFRSYCEREALYVIAMCQAASEARKAEWEAQSEAEQKAVEGSYQDLKDKIETFLVDTQTKD